VLFEIDESFEFGLSGWPIQESFGFNPILVVLAGATPVTSPDGRCQLLDYGSPRRRSMSHVFDFQVNDHMMGGTPLDPNECKQIPKVVLARAES
jgi:hypothetical protein